MTLKQTLRKIQLAEARIKMLKAEADVKRSELTFHCVICGTRHVIKDCVALQNHSYTPPRGCSDGDYWTADEIWIMCQHHPYANRLLFSSKYNVPWNLRDHYAHDAEGQFRRMYMHLFAKNLNQYREQVKHANNHQVDCEHAYYGIDIGYYPKPLKT